MLNISLRSLLLTIILLIAVAGSAQYLTRKVSFQKDRITIKEAIIQIEKQTGYSIAYEQSGLDLSRVVSLSVKNADINHTLKLLLKDTGYTYKIKGYHIILSVSPEKNKDETKPDEDALIPIENTIAGDESYTFTGVVIDSVNHEPLSYATVSLSDRLGNQLSAGITDDKGSFRIKTSRMPSNLSVSFVGYTTFSKKINTQGTVGKILLSPNIQMLKGATITADAVEYKVDRNVYFVTEEMREKASNAQELLDQVHGVRFDRLSNTIRVGSETAILLLIDGVQQSDVYIKNLPPERISKIEVITEPGGRYLSDGYAAIINYILKKDYSGYDVNIRNFSMISINGYNDRDRLINEQPGGGITYTKDKINLFLNYTYGKIQMNTPIWKKQIYTDLLEMYPVKTEIDKPNNRYEYESNYVGAGINYQLAPDHSISFQGDYTYQNIEEKNSMKYNVLHVGSDKWTQTNTSRKDATKDNDYVATVFYKGEIAKRLKLYSDFTYNYYSNKVSNDYAHGEDDYAYNDYHESKNYTKFNLEGEYTFSPKFMLNLGYVNVWRKYRSESNEHNTPYLYYNEWRNQLFSYLQYKANDKLTVKAGVSAEYIRTYYESKNNDWSILPYFQLNYKANKNVNLHLSYKTNSYYPTLFQLSTLTTTLDSLIRQSGNPNLRSAVRHTISAKLTLWNRFSINPMYKYTPKRISEIYKNGVLDRALFSTFENINVKQYAIQAIYDQPLGKYFTLNNIFTYYYDKATHKDLSSSYHGWMLDSEIKYFNPKWELGAQIGYYRSIDKSAMLQGYQMVNLDSWMISFNKQFWNKQASLMISYFPPLSWGIRDELKREINTPFYTEKYTQSLKPYRNMLMVRFSLRFNSGNVKSIIKQSSTEKEERRKRAVDF